MERSTINLPERGVGDGHLVTTDASGWRPVASTRIPVKVFRRSYLDA
jgi:hypothetical protein